MFIGALISAAFILVFAFVQHLQSDKQKKQAQRIQSDQEMVLTMDDKLIFEFKSKMNYQQVMLLYEVFDMSTDIGKPIYVYLTKDAYEGNPLWLVALCSAIALFAIYNALTNIPKRRRVLQHLRSIIEGEALHQYAIALYGHEAHGHETETITEDNIMLKLDKCVLYIELEDINSQVRKTRIEKVVLLVQVVPDTHRAFFLCFAPTLSLSK